MTEPTTQPVQIANSASHIMQSGAGHRYQISVAWPAAPTPSDGFPVVYVLDANAIFATTVEMIRARSARAESTGVLPAIVVGIGYPPGEPDSRARRMFDFTSCVPTVGDDGTNANASAGGADALREFMALRVRPDIERRFAISATRQCVVGHSLSALFVLESLLQQPDAYSDYVAISASVWWDYARLRAAIARQPTQDFDANVMLFVGEYEEAMAPWQMQRTPDEIGRIQMRRAARQMIGRMQEVSRELSGMTNGRVTCDVIPGEDHASVVPVALSSALRAMLAP